MSEDWSFTQQKGFLAAMPFFLILVSLQNLFPAAPNGNVLAADLFWRTIFTIIPSIIGFSILAFSKFKKPLEPMHQGIILASQSAAIIVSIFLVAALPIQTAYTAASRRLIHKTSFMVPMTIILLFVLGLTIWHFVKKPKGNPGMGENPHVVQQSVENACLIDPLRLRCKCSKDEFKNTTECLCGINPKSKECLCATDPKSEACICATDPKSKECKNFEGFNGDTNVYKIENAKIFQTDPAAITDPRLNVNFKDMTFIPDESMENFYNHAMNTNRTRKLIFGN